MKGKPKRNLIVISVKSSTKADIMLLKPNIRSTQDDVIQMLIEFWKMYHPPATSLDNGTAAPGVPDTPEG